MPIYEYNCAKCNNSFEHFARTSSDHPNKCPECGSRRVKKQLSAFATKKTFQMASGYGKSAKAPACPTSESGKKENGKKDSDKKDSGKKDSGKKPSCKKESCGEKK